MSRYKGRVSTKRIEHDYPHIVELVVPDDGFGRRLDDMHAWCRARGIESREGRGHYEEGRWYARWCFADAEIAAAFKSEFG